MIKRRADMRVEMRERIRGGEGTLRCVNILEKDETLGKMRYCALLHLEPGQSIGLHAHGPDAELFYVLEGRVTVTDNGETTDLREGDAMFTGDGATHSARNDTDRLAVLMAVILH